MAIETANLGFISVNGVDLSARARRVSLNNGGETLDATAHGDSNRKFRPGLGTISVEAEFFNDNASGSVESTLRGLRTIASTGFTVITQRKAGSASTPTSTNNPKYTAVMIIDGDLNSLDDTVGELPMVTVRFVSYDGTLTVSTSATS